MFTLIVLVIAVLTAILPALNPLLAEILRLKTHKAPTWLPLIAAILFFVSFYIPDINVSSDTVTFQQHLIGGGMYCAVLYVYFKRLFGWQFNWIADLVILFAWVSAFGVANKLLEFALAESHLMILDMSDAYWDLLANTIGAYVGYGIVRLVSLLSIN